MATLQQPVQSPFNAASTAAEVMAGIDLRGQLAVVTGGYSGLGLLTAKSLAAAGAQVIVPARDTERAEVALAGVDGVRVLPMDLMQAESVAAFSQSVVSAGQPLSLLINCAGIMAAPLLHDADGHESQFATNHLGHYRLTCGLWPALVRAGQARVLSVSSRGHQLPGWILTTSIFYSGRMTNGLRMANRKRRMPCLPSHSISVDGAMAFARSRCIRGRFSRIWRGT